MRHLTRRPHGMTLIELMVGLAVVALLLAQAAPYFGDYLANSRLREAGSTLHAEALFAQSEAIKRNGTVRLTVAGDALRVTDFSTNVQGVLVREQRLADGIDAGNGTVDFSARGQPVPFGTNVSFDLSKTGLTCSDEFRCPGLRIDGAGGMRLCRNKLSCP